LSNVGLLPLDQLVDQNLRHLLAQFIAEDDRQIARHEDHVLELRQKDLGLKNTHQKPSILTPTGPKNFLSLYCPRHKAVSLHAFNGAALLKGSPNGGCSAKCEKTLECGRICQARCHPLDDDHSTEAFRCQDHLIERICPDGHKTRGFCWEKECQVEVAFEPCSHVESSAGIIKCFQVRKLDSF